MNERKEEHKRKDYVILLYEFVHPNLTDYISRIVQNRGFKRVIYIKINWVRLW